MKTKMKTKLILLISMAIYIGGCGQTCKQQYNVVNYSCGASYQTTCDLQEANVIGDAALKEAFTIATAMEKVRPELRVMAENNACQTDNWRQTLQILQTLLTELQNRNMDQLERLQAAYKSGTLQGIGDDTIIKIINLIIELLLRWPVQNDEIDLATETWVQTQYERMKQLAAEIEQ